MSKVSELIKDLNDVPSIVASLGLSIAQAQKALNLDYLNNIKELMAQIKQLMGDAALDDANRDFFQTLLLQLAPSRYQFTETTLAVKMDLGKTFKLDGSLGAGGSLGAVAVNASLTVGYGYDYNAAAEVRTVLHAASPDEEVFKDLIARADKIPDNLGSDAGVDKQIADTAAELKTQ